MVMSLGMGGKQWLAFYWDYTNARETQSGESYGRTLTQWLEGGML